MNKDWEDFIDRIKSRVDIATVALSLGMKLVRPAADVPTTQCLFHDDRSPSMSLYRNRGGEGGAYHCFACSAHGDVFDLVIKKLGCTFQQAVEWLAGHLGESEPATQTPHKKAELTGLSGRVRGLAAALEIFQRMTIHEKRILQEFSRRRQFDLKKLTAAEVFAVAAGKITRGKRRAYLGRQLEADLEEAGLLVRREIKSESGQGSLPNLGISDFFWDDRVVFLVRNHRGELAGFAGRAVSLNAKVKYLYSKGFRRSQILYGLWSTRRRIREMSAAEINQVADVKKIELFLVEGILDALRLESVGLNACALLGSSLSKTQATLLGELADEVAAKGAILAIHIFLDNDGPGRAAVAGVLRQLWESLLELGKAPIVDVICFAGGEAGKDPDEILKNEEGTLSLSFLHNLLISPAQFLLAEVLEVEPPALETYWNQVAPAKKQWALNQLEAKLLPGGWQQVFQRLRPLAALNSEKRESEVWQMELSSVLGSGRSRKFSSAEESSSTPRAEIPATRMDQQRLYFAHELAMASRHRREFPIDDGSWARLGAAFDLIAEFYREVLSEGRARRLEPFMAVHLPKASGGLRLKALPCPEDLTLQQYILSEVLRNHVPHPDFARSVPAVRWSNGHLSTTGWREGENYTSRAGAVSFAYQVDMDVLGGMVPPGSRALFRPYFDCWRDYISHLNRGVSSLAGDLLYPDRLDIRSFYDMVRRTVVNEALLGPLTQALSTSGFDSRSVAPLFAPGSTLSSQRARDIVDWFCDHSFNYTYIDPSNGEVKATKYPDIGLPQGPDLSAYLANIVLFRLDQAVVREIEELSKINSGVDQINAAVYARYVDDIVLVATSARILGSLRSVIEFELGRLGLSLSSKLDPLPSMAPGQVRKWLTEQRSHGAEYGPTAGVEPEILVTLPSWPDSNIEIDRGTALQLIYTQPSEEVVRNPAQVLRNVELARQAKLRPSDEVGAIRLLWLIAAGGAQAAKSQGAEQAKKLSDSINLLWNSEPQSEAKLVLGEEEQFALDFRRSWRCFALLEGLLLALRSRGDRSPRSSSAEQKDLFEIRCRLAMAVTNGLCDLILERDVNPDGFAVQKSAWYQTICAAAAEILRGNCSSSAKGTEFKWNIGDRRVPYLFRLACSLQAYYPDAAILEDVHPRPERGSVRAERDGSFDLLCFHEAVARLSAKRRTQPRISETVDVLHALEAAIRMPGASTKRSFLARGLDLWLADDSAGSEGVSSEEALSSLAALVNVANQRLTELLPSRKRLLGTLKQVFGISEAFRFLPVPPAVGYPGLLATDSQSIVVFMFSSRNEHLSDAEASGIDPMAGFQPGGMVWEALKPAVENSAGISLRAYKANLMGWSFAEFAQEPLVRIPDHEKIEVLEKITEAYRQVSAASWEIVASASHLLKRIGVDGSEEWALLGFSMPMAKDAPISYVLQRHSGSLIAEPILAEYAPLWRLGTALADLWYGIDRQNSSPASQLSASSLCLGEEQSPLVESMLRLTIFRLRGLHLVTPVSPPRVASSTSTPVPITRALGHSEKFIKAYKAGEFHRLLDLAISNFLEYRIRLLRSDPRNSLGEAGVAQNLCKAVGEIFGADAKIRQLLPPLPILPSWSPKRRPARAWFALAERISLVPSSSNEESDLFLVIAGFRILAVMEVIREQVLERWSALDPEARVAKNWHFDLPDDWFASSEFEYVTGNSEVDFAHAFASISVLPVEASVEVMNSITPVGWVALLAGLSGMLPGNDLRPAMPVSEVNRRDIECEMRWLVELFSLRASVDTLGETTSYREIASPFYGPDAYPRLSKIFAALDQLDSLASAVVSLDVSGWISARDRVGGMFEIRTSKLTTRSLPEWALRKAVLRSPKERWEHAIDGVGGGSPIFKASLVEMGGRLVGMSWISQDLSELSGLDRELDTEDSEEAPSSLARGLDPALAVPTSQGKSADQKEMPGESQRRSGDQPRVSVARSNEQIPALENILKFQAASWKRRGGAKRSNFSRVALLQWKVDDTYRHPIFDICSNGGGYQLLGGSSLREVLQVNAVLRDKLDGPSPDPSGRARSIVSCSEHRRRKILEHAIRACEAFKVDLLLLPEYSVRPDTIDWLSDPKQIAHPSTSVWAGTYRLPPDASEQLGRNKNDRTRRDAWSAILSAVIPSSDGQYCDVKWRSKKYAAQLLDEIFCPNRDRIIPLYSAAGDEKGARGYTFDTKRLAMELICSEVFLATSPANWRALASTLHELNWRLQIDPLATEEKAFEQVVEDARFLSDFISYHSTSQFPRRSIVLVPAMTRRTVDYVAFGQLNYLAAGITTVFCNAAEKSGIGNSCFIGLDCWDRSDRVGDKGLPGDGPYHGILPGIFKQYEAGRGWLGKSEQALVIADIDPLQTLAGDPRPQSLLKPLSLVAHIPIIESWKVKERDGTESACCCSNRQQQTLSNEQTSEGGQDWVSSLADLLKEREESGVQFTYSDSDPNELADLLNSLAQRAGHKAGDWLCRRAKAYRENYRSDPSGWPPPAALDWLWVDLGETGSADHYPSVEVPCFRKEPES